MDRSIVLSSAKSFHVLTMMNLRLSNPREDSEEAAAGDDADAERHLSQQYAANDEGDGRKDDKRAGRPCSWSHVTPTLLRRRERLDGGPAVAAEGRSISDWLTTMRTVTPSGTQRSGRRRRFGEQRQPGRPTVWAASVVTRL